MKIATPKVQFKTRAIVRDKYGHPKFDDPAKIVDFIDRLSDQDIEYLRGKYGKDICDIRRSTTSSV